MSQGTNNFARAVGLIVCGGVREWVRRKQPILLCVLWLPVENPDKYLSHHHRVYARVAASNCCKWVRSFKASNYNIYNFQGRHVVQRQSSKLRNTFIYKVMIQFCLTHLHSHQLKSAPLTEKWALWRNGEDKKFPGGCLSTYYPPPSLDSHVGLNPISEREREILVGNKHLCRRSKERKKVVPTGCATLLLRCQQDHRKIVDIRGKNGKECFQSLFSS